ncbi:extracellular solute-binding protein [Xylanimonas allomyrinae]|uniref:Extracellular solute-binding protein n=1 Tax=Xylanimonas allomyrinae TaxID=2509459 RepID=A0A4P6EXL4_9MICO|nr:extracellular solute-binding protein [Xylanimonas allomyrinae]QAY62788.1 extracellular solute-binding protein [Xylanimonas allomyrinae]
MHHRISQRARAATAAIAIATLALTACSTSTGSGSDDASDGGSIDVVTRWASGSPEAAVQKRVFDAFTAETGIKLNVTEGLENIDDQVETAVAAGKSPDLVIVNLFDKTLGWLDAGVTVAADQYVEDWGLADTLKPDALKAWRVGGTDDGELQGLPFSGFSWPVWYNTDLLTSAGVDEIPQTTDDLIAAAAKLRSAGIGPLVVGGSDWTGQKLFYQIAQSFTDAAAMKTVMQKGGYCSTDSVMQGIELFTELRDGGVFVDNAAGLNSDDMYAQYYSQKAAIMSAGSWAYAGAVDAGTGVEKVTTLGGFPLPGGAAFDKPTAFQDFTGVGFMITKEGAQPGHIEKVRQLIEALYTEANVGDFVQTTSLLPSVTGDFTAFAANPLLAQSLKLDQSVSIAVLPDVWIGSASDPIIQVLTSAYGSSSAQQICQGLDDATASAS